VLPLSAELSWRHRAIRAELALFRGDIDEVDALLTQVPLAERPILSYALPQVQLLMSKAVRWRWR
jgi:hypothetical protein